MGQNPGKSRAKPGYRKNPLWTHAENEGPRGPFRAKLDRKLATWEGPPVAGRVHVLEDPWARFTLTNEQHRAELARFVAEHGIDLVVFGPLAAIGAEGGGTPDDVSAFERLLVDVRARAARPLAYWIAHHENKAGDVSGAWARLPDALVHARLEGRERTILHWRKARWSSGLHGATWKLAWATEREGFDLIDREEETAIARAAKLADATDWIVAYVTEHPGASRGTVEDAYHEAHEGGRNTARDAINEQLERLRQPENERRGEPVLATTTGARKNGIYLIPFTHATSPLADPLFGEDGEEGPNPAPGEAPRRSPPPRRGGEQSGGEEADGVSDDPDDDLELDWR